MFCGAQVSLYPMCGRFVDVILGAVARVKGREGLRIETDDLSTLMVGTPPAVFEAVGDLFLEAARSGEHVVLNALFSRGCPGEPDDPICIPPGAGGGTDLVDVPGLPGTGIEITGQYSVYPLGSPSYMSVVLEQIEAAKREGTYNGAKHFTSRLEGDGARVFGTLYNAFERAAKESGHVVVHATLSANSPSVRGVKNE
jgi:hypothetical protein